MKAVNLLPNDQRSVKTPSPAKVTTSGSGSAFGAYAILGALALAVVAFAAMVLVNNSISDRETKLAQVQAQAAAAASKAAALKPYADFKQIAAARVQTVQSLATTRFDWERTLRDLSHALPRDARLTNLTGSTGGKGGSTAAPSIDLAGCTRSQTAVARLMARLRAVRGVTRVVLKSSAKSGDTANAAGAGAGAGASLCGPGDKPTFGLSILFERFNVPAVTGAPAAAAPAAAATPGAAATPAATPAPGTTGTTAPGTTSSAASSPPGSTSSTQGVSAP